MRSLHGCGCIRAAHSNCLEQGWRVACQNSMTAVCSNVHGDKCISMRQAEVCVFWEEHYEACMQAEVTGLCVAMAVRDIFLCLYNIWHECR